MPTIEPIADLTGFESALAQFRWPKGDFDPLASWAQHWSIHLSTHGEQGRSSRKMGAVWLRRRAGPGDFQLEVSQRLFLDGGAAQLQKASLRCMADPLGGLLSWSLQSEVLRADGQPEPLCSLYDEGSPEPAGPPLTTEWALMEAVQRLPEAGDGLPFALLSELSVLKLGQTLRFLDAAELELAGERHFLFGYQHAGVASLPTRLWVDEGGRLVFVRTALRLFALKSPA